MKSTSTFRLKLNPTPEQKISRCWTGKPRAKSLELSTDVHQRIFTRLAKDKMIFSHTDEEGFDVYKPHS